MWTALVVVWHVAALLVMLCILGGLLVLIDRIGGPSPD